MDDVGRTLLALSLHDDEAIDELVSSSVPEASTPVAASRTAALVQLGALVCLDAETTTFQVHVDRGLAAGAEPDDLLAALAAVAPLVGTARLAAGAASLARALGYDLDGAIERHDGPDGPAPRPSSAA